MMRVRCRVWGVVAVLVGAGVVSAQGLEPPAGPVAPTMKPMSEVEPRVAVNAVNTPGDKAAVFVITRPGSYYVTAAVAGEAGKSGIEIAASHVTLDLAGFDLKGMEKGVAGVRVRGAQTDVVVRNGSTRGWPVAGIDTTDALVSVIEDVRSDGNGLGILASANSSVRRCIATHNTGGGIHGGRSVTVEDCICAFNTGLGMYVLETSRVLRCTFENNTTDGLYLDGAGCIVTECIGVGNGRHGIAVIYGAAMTACTMDNNSGDGFWSLPNTPATWVECRATGNVGDGIDAGDGSSVTRCVLHGNGENGVRVRDRVNVSACQSVGQVNGAGVLATGTASRIDGNTLTGNRVGVRVDSKGCLVVRNSVAASEAAAYDIAPGNAFGPIVEVMGAGDVGAVAGSGHPLANLVY